MKKLFLALIALIAATVLQAQTTYVVWHHGPLADGEKWINSNYYVWENTYTQTNVGDALEFTPTGKGWIGGGYESAQPFDLKVLTDGYDLVFDIRTTDTKELSVQLTCARPEAAQSAKLKFDRNGEWQTVRLSLKKHFPQVLKAWSEAQDATHGYVFSIVGGATPGTPLSLRNIRYEKTR